MLVDHGVSDHSPWTVIITLVGFTLLYGALAVVWFWLIRRAVLMGPPAELGPEPVASENNEKNDDPTQNTVHFTATANAAGQERQR